MTTLKVPEMHCNHCVERITNALTGAGLHFEVSLENQTVSVDGCSGCVEKAVSELEDLGFSAEKL